MIKIYTGNYQNCNVPKGICISDDDGKSVGFEGKVMRELAPKKSWWQVWHDQIGILSEEDNLRFYVEHYYETVLKHTSPANILLQLEDGSIFLCYEDPKDFCHRDIVAVWLELYYGIEVREVKVLENDKVKILPRNKYYDVIKEMLETLIKSDMDMQGHTSIAVAYAYSRALQLAKDTENGAQPEIPAETMYKLAELLEKKFEGEHKQM